MFVGFCLKSLNVIKTIFGCTSNIDHRRHTYIFYGNFMKEFADLYKIKFLICISKYSKYLEYCVWLWNFSMSSHLRWTNIIVTLRMVLTVVHLKRPKISKWQIQTINSYFIFNIFKNEQWIRSLHIYIHTHSYVQRDLWQWTIASNSILCAKEDGSFMCLGTIAKYSHILFSLKIPRTHPQPNGRWRTRRSRKERTKQKRQPAMHTILQLYVLVTKISMNLNRFNMSDMCTMYGDLWCTFENWKSLYDHFQCLYKSLQMLSSLSRAFSVFIPFLRSIDIVTVCVCVCTAYIYRWPTRIESKHFRKSKTVNDEWDIGSLKMSSSSFFSYRCCLATFAYCAKSHKMFSLLYLNLKAFVRNGHFTSM